MLAFIAIEKTAGVTMTRILRQSFGMSHFDLCCFREYHREHAKVSTYDLKRGLAFHPWVKCISGHTVVPYAGFETICPNLTYLTFVRDPLKRCASHYQWQVQAGMTSMAFDEWIQIPAYRNFMCRKLTGGESASDAVRCVEDTIGFVGLMERFDESLVLLQAWSEDPIDIRYEPQNVAPDNAIKESLLRDPHSRQLLIEANREDSRLYQHIVESVFPRQCRQYAEDLQSRLAAFRESNHPRRMYPRHLPSLLYRHTVYRTAARIATLLNDTISADR